MASRTCAVRCPSRLIVNSRQTRQLHHPVRNGPHILHATAAREYSSELQASTPTSTPFSPTKQNTRHLHTSRQSRQAGDTSTIDFAYLPNFPNPPLDPLAEDIRVPLVPWNFIPRAEEVSPPLVSEIIAEQEQSISTAAADGTHLSSPSAMADVHDGGGHLLDLHEVAETLTSAAKKITLGTEREAHEEAKRAKGLMKQVWTGLVADLFGQKAEKP